MKSDIPMPIALAVFAFLAWCLVTCWRNGSMGKFELTVLSVFYVLGVLAFLVINA
jgi:hypothetical protein